MALELYLVLAATALIGCVMLGAMTLRGFTAWLDLKRAELDRSVAPPTIGSRIDVADLKERVRKLEAIAAGVDL